MPVGLGPGRAGIVGLAGIWRACMLNVAFMTDQPPSWRPQRPRPPPPGFECGERVATHDGHVASADDEAEDVGVVSFYCTLPPLVSSSCDVKRKLTFSCRGRSVGALLPTESSVDEAMLDSADAYETVDPFLFNEDYSPAGKTGFQVWSGTRLLIESLCWVPITAEPNSEVTASEERLGYYQKQILSADESHDAMNGSSDRCNILELGSGVGVVGATLAAVGSNVMLTDLPTLVENAVWPNLMRNMHKENNNVKAPSWLKDAVRIGKGWASATPLDWTKPLSSGQLDWTKPLSPDQLNPSQIESIDMIVASDCVWLVSMLEALLDTVRAVFEQSKRSPTFIMSFQRRDGGGDDSALFTTVDRVLTSVTGRGWSFDCLAWRPVQLGDGEGDKEVFIFEIRP